MLADVSTRVQAVIRTKPYLLQHISDTPQRSAVDNIRNFPDQNLKVQRFCGNMVQIPAVEDPSGSSIQHFINEPKSKHTVASSPSS